MNALEPHELSLIPPPLTSEEEFALEESLLKNGQIDDIIIYEGKILDGKHKYKLLVKHGKEPRVKEFIPNGVTAMDFVMARLEGRNLNPGQKACVAAILSQAEKKNPLDNLIYKKGKGKLREGGSKAEKYHRQDANRTCTKVSKSIGIGSNSTMKAIVLMKHNKELFQRVYEGSMSVNAGYNQHRKNTGSLKKRTDQTKTNIEALKSKIITIPNCYASNFELKEFIKVMNAHGWILEMRYQDGKVLAHWFGNGYVSVGTNWSTITPEPGEVRAVVVAANDKRSKII